jgi:hypothetical protein
VVIEAPLVKKRKLKKVVEPTSLVVNPIALVVEPAAPVVELAAQGVKAVNVAGFLAARRRTTPLPSMPRMADVEAFLANEPILVVPVKVIELVAEKPLHAPMGPIPSMLNHPLCSNIQHILEDLDMESKESVGMADDNMGPSATVTVGTP